MKYVRPILRTELGFIGFFDDRSRAGIGATPHSRASIRMYESLPLRQTVFLNNTFFRRPIVEYLVAEDRSQGLAAQAVGAQRRALTAATGGRIDDLSGEGKVQVRHSPYQNFTIRISLDPLA